MLRRSRLRLGTPWSAQDEFLQQPAARYGVEVALDMFADLFRRRREGEDIKLSRALERNFDQPSTPIEQSHRV